MEIKGNKGEWSEIYVFLKLLGEGKIYAGDENMNKIKDLFYPIIMILRQEKESHLNYKLENKDVVILTPDNKELLRTPASTFLIEAENLLNAINTNTGVFSVPAVEEFMKSIKCQQLKAKSSDKADIHIILHDQRTKINSEMGFSIKSKLGEDSTLLNAGTTTNFTYSIEGANLTEKQINDINAINGYNKIIKRYEAIKQQGGSLLFKTIDNSKFRNNLAMMDGDLGSILSHLLKEHFESGKSSLKELTEILNEKNPLNYDMTQESPFYAYKLKHLLTATALGMKPGEAWDGKLDANGGYIVVKKDGDIVCYHFYDRNRFEDYLFANAYLEQASSSRHKYASIFKGDDGLLYFKLNLQIRMK